LENGSIILFDESSAAAASARESEIILGNVERIK
jgi:hypothetical protein